MRSTKIFPLQFTKVFTIGTKKLQFIEEKKRTAIGGRIWPAAELFVRFLEREAKTLVKNRRILELGSGCGFTGICCAVLGAKSVILSEMLIDQHYTFDDDGVPQEKVLCPNRNILLDLCQQNVDSNSSSIDAAACLVSVEELTWGQENVKRTQELLSKYNDIDLIVGSELTVNKEASIALFWTVAYILRRHRNQKSKFIIIHQNRCNNLVEHLGYAELQGLSYRQLHFTDDPGESTGNTCAAAANTSQSLWEFSYNPSSPI